MVLAALSLGVSGVAAADPRIASRLFHPDEVVTIHGREGIQSTIAFGEDERIENIAVGDSATWQVTPNKRADLLFIKPVAGAVRTNMTVVTDRHTYLFDLTSSPRAPAVYMLRFAYPPAPRVPQRPPPVVAPVAVAAALTPPPVVRHVDWIGRGDRKLLPVRSWDDGHSVHLQWGADAVLPAILIREADGTEGPVNFTLNDGTIVVEGMPSRLVLRSGKAVATLDPPPAASAAPPDQPAGGAVALARGDRP